MAGTTGLFTIVFPDHYDKLADGLWNQFRGHQGVDFDLRFAGRSIRAHRLILDVFLSPDKLARCGQQMNHGDSHPDPPTVEAGLEAYLPSTNYLDCLLEFLYRGRVTVGEEILERLLELAGELDLLVLVDAIKAVWNGKSDSVQTDPKRRRRKGIPVKRSNPDGDDPGQSGEDPDDPPYEENPRPVAKVTIGFKRSRGRSRGTGVDRAAVVKRRKKGEEEQSEKGRDVSAEVGEDATPVKRRRKSEKSGREKGKPASLRPGYKRLWLQKQPLLSCPHCPYETHCKRSFRIHESRHDKTAQVYRCDVCSVAFLTEDTLERHKSSQHTTALTTHSCQLCDYTTTKDRNLRSHMLAVHRLNAKGMPVAKTFDCPLCDFTSAFASHLATHEMTHNPEKPIHCEECSYSCTRKYELDKHHKAVHLNQRLFLCVECGHKSATRVHLGIHMRTHTNDRPFTCVECGKAYKSKEKLKIHAQRHLSDEKPFTCDICGFSAYRRDNLQMHMKRIHKTTLPK